MTSPPAWSIQRDDATVFLFGVRPGARGTEWISDRVAAAIAACDEFWRETPPEDEISSSPLLAEFALSSDVPLSERVDEDTRSRLDAVTGALSMDRSTFEGFRPWVAAQFVQQAALERAGVPPDQNMDVVLARLAEEHGAAIEYEFDVEGVIRTFGGMPEPIELDYLRFILDAAEGGSALIDEGFSAWLRGDRQLDELGDADLRLRYPDLYELLIRERNAAWIPRIDAMLSRPGTRFVAVGCGHLAGPDSVLSMLEQVDCQITSVGDPQDRPKPRRWSWLLLPVAVVALAAGSNLAGQHPEGCGRFTHLLLEFGAPLSHVCWVGREETLLQALLWDTFLLVPVYVMVLAGASRLLAASRVSDRIGEQTSDPFMSAVTANARALSRLGVTAAVLAGAFDWLENLTLAAIYIYRHRIATSTLPLIFALPKFVFIVIALLVSVRGVARFIRSRKRTTIPDLDVVGPSGGAGAWERNTRVPSIRPDDAPRRKTVPSGIGIALSGGGIRSGTFAMGAVQALQDCPLTGDGANLDYVRYLSAVSGGGYFATARQLVLATDVSPEPDEPFRPGSFEEDWVRRHGKYLAESAGEWMRALTVVLAGIVLNTGLLVGALFVFALPAGWFQRAALFTRSEGLRPSGVMWGAVGVTFGAALIAYLCIILFRRSDGTGDPLGDWLLRIANTGLLAGAVVVALVFVLPGLSGLSDWLTQWLNKKAAGSPGTPAIATGGGLLGALATWLAARSGDGALKKVWLWVKARVTRKDGGTAEPARGGLVQKLRLIRWLPGVLLGLTALFLVARFASLGRDFGPTGDLALLGIGVPPYVFWSVLLAVLIALYVVSDQTSWSLHPYYKRRLSTAFGIEREPTGAVGQLEYDVRTGLECYGLAPRGPQLILCCAANLSGKVAPPGRKAVPFTFSHDWIGGPQLGYVTPSSMRTVLGPRRDGDITLIAAMAISGAAVTSAMGRHSKGSVNAALAVFNVRLGVWLPSPDHLLCVREGVEPKPGRRRLDYVVREIFGSFDAHDPYLYITDGGHVENLGVLELLRRRCRTIICIDGSGGPLTLVEMIELANEELGVEFEFEVELASVREGSAPDRDRFPVEIRARMAATRILRAKIVYPALADDLPSGEGEFIYARAVLTPETDDLILEYAVKHPLFPNDGTGDQFFDVDQFNHYLAIGREAGEQASSALERLRERVVSGERA